MFYFWDIFILVLKKVLMEIEQILLLIIYLRLSLDFENESNSINQID